MATRIDELAQTIIDEYAEENPLFVCFLKGGSLFSNLLMHRMATLAEEAGTVFHPDLDYMIISTYGDGTEASDSDIVTDLANPGVVNNRLVFMVDEVLETGTTMKRGEEHFRSLGASDVKSVVLVQKTGQERSLYPEATLYGFESPHGEWLVGMGMNNDPRYPGVLEASRWLGYIASVGEIDAQNVA